jgi:restriction system protein
VTAVPYPGFPSNCYSDPGYGGSHEDAAKVVGRSGDGGIDGIIKEDRLGFDSIYVQAKRWESTVGRPTVQQFAGALQGQRARKGVIITTSNFTREAVEYAAALQSTIILTDGAQLAQLMIDYGIGVAEVETIRLKRVDEEYFAEE